MSQRTGGRFPVTPRTELSRLPERGGHDRDTVLSILDEAFVCHVGFTIEDQPYIIPMLYGRSGDNLYIHGSPGSRLLLAMRSGIEVCVEVTLIDGLVLARSAFHHSLNYRSVVLFGRANRVPDGQPKLDGLKAISDHLLPGRWEDVRPPSERELRQTLVLAVPLREASSKVRMGPAMDDDADLVRPTWAGVVPMGLTCGEPMEDLRLPAGTPQPLYLQWLVRSRRPR